MIIIVILFIMLFNNKNENMADTNKDTNKVFTTKSNQAIQNLASMYNSNLLRATKADIPIITSTNISANVINTSRINASQIDADQINTGQISAGQISTDTINVGRQITSRRFCDQNNNCIDNAFLQRVNNTLANENVFFRNEMVVWDNLNDHVQKDIVSIPNDKNITYAMSVKKLNNDKYILGINSDTTFEIQIPQVPENASYEYSVLWLQVEQPDIYWSININGIDYYIPPNITFSTQKYSNYGEMFINTDRDINTIVPYNQILTYNTFINLQENINNNNFVWIPYIIKNLNQSKKIKISIKSQKYENGILWISSIAFSSNPLNLSMNNIQIKSQILYGYNEFNNYTQVPAREWHWNYTIQDFIRDKKIPQSYTIETRLIKIPYINSGKNKVLTLTKPYNYNSEIALYIQTGINSYMQMPIAIYEDAHLRNKPLNKFVNQEFINIILDKSLSNYDKNYINLKIIFIYYNLHDPSYYTFGYNEYYRQNYWWQDYRYIKYFYEGYSGTTVIGTYDLITI